MAKARELEIRGWVRNLPDGRVELVAEAPREHIEALAGWCRTGPPGAHVDEVEMCEDTERTELGQFQVRYG